MLRTVTTLIVLSIAFWAVLNAGKNDAECSINYLASKSRHALVQVLGRRSKLNDRYSLISLILTPRAIGKVVGVRIDPLNSRNCSLENAKDSNAEFVSFFPPAVLNQPREFLINVKELDVDMLAISLLPIDDSLDNDFQIEVSSHWAK